jgi:hypothetical protein
MRSSDLICIFSRDQIEPRSYPTRIYILYYVYLNGLEVVLLLGIFRRVPHPCALLLPRGHPALLNKNKFKFFIGNL